MASLFSNREAAETVLMRAWSEHVSLMDLVDIPCLGMGVAGGGYEWRVTKGERKPFSAPFDYVLKS